MAATHPDVALPAERPVRRRVPRALLVAAATFLALALAGAGVAAAWLGYEAAFEGRVVPGVAVAGIDLSGQTPADARAALAPVLGERFAGRVEVTVAGRVWTATFADLGRGGDVEATIAAALQIGRRGDLATQIRERAAVLSGRIDVEPVLAFDPLPLRSWVAGIGAAVDEAPRPAAVRWTPTGPAVDLEEEGLRLDQAALVERTEAVLGDRDARGVLALDGRTATVPAARTDIHALATILAAERMTAAPVTLKAGIRTWTLEGDLVRGWIRLAETPQGQVPLLDRASIAAAIPDVVERTVKRVPVETSILETRGGDRVGFVAGKPGRHLDRATTAGRIADLLRARAAGRTGDAPVRVAASPVALERTDAEVAGGLPELVAIGTWTTSYQVSERNGFGANITIPARLIDGTYLQPGAAFDFWGAVGPVTYGRGFRDGAIIIGGRSQPTGAIAGGICSASTTLFNAAARAGLQILERDNHYYYIDRYPLGLDATVSKKAGRIVQNMRFRNDTAHPIFIRGSAGPGWVRFTLYSRPNGREVAFSTPEVWNVAPARDTTVLTSTLPAGETKRLEYPVQGMNVLVTRTVREGGRVLHRDEFFTRYGKVDGILQVGTG